MHSTRVGVNQLTLRTLRTGASQRGSTEDPESSKLNVHAHAGHGGKTSGPSVALRGEDVQRKRP
jgi:hypothetical protein